MRGSSTDDSFMRNRLTYKRAKCCERTGRKSQYFPLISVLTYHCVCVSVCFVTPTARTSALCIIMDPVPTGEPAVDSLWMLLQLPLPLSLPPFPGSFSLFQGCLEEWHPPPLKGFWTPLQMSHTHTHPHTAVRARFGVTAETWLRWAEGDVHTKHTCITYADTLNGHKEHFRSSLSKVRLDDHSQALQTANDSQTCFHGLPLFMSTNSNEYCKNMTDAIYSNSTAIKLCQGGTPL